MSSSSSNTKAAAPIPPSKPIDILQNQYALFYANLHPIVLLSILLFSFRTLVEDPVNTLLGLAPTITILQAVYCVLSLPPKGQTAASSTKPGQKKKAQKPGQDIWAKIVVCE
jgi:GPI ethanolamine phosphate transferase 2/3 subunit F